MHQAIQNFATLWRYLRCNLNPKQTHSDLGDVVQQSFVKSLYCVGMHLHTVGDQLDEVGNRIVTHIASCLQRGAKLRDGSN